MSLLKFYKCRICGNVVVKAVDSSITPYCCGKEMTELESGQTDASIESHMPVIQRLDYHTLRVSIGEKPHPMTFEHHICFICLETTKGFNLRHIATCRQADIYFFISDDIIAVYAYCNIHGLWKLPLLEIKEKPDKKD